MNDQARAPHLIAAHEQLARLLPEVRACRYCPDLPLGPRPVVQLDARARLLVIGQAPGTRVHATGIPWNDASGATLRAWLDLSPEAFYDPARVAIMPMGLCYPGRGRGGDLPPRAECAPRWHAPLRAQLPELQLTLLIGRHAQQYYLGRNAGTVSDVVQRYQAYLADGWLPLPHPSPRNRLWLRQRPWFEHEVVPALQACVARVLEGHELAADARPAAPYQR